jgi:hypothetical protein
MVEMKVTGKQGTVVFHHQEGLGFRAFASEIFDPDTGVSNYSVVQAVQAPHPPGLPSPANYPPGPDFTVF